MIWVIIYNFFKKIQSGEMKLEEAKKMQNVFKSNLKEMSRGRYKTEEQKMTSENYKLLYKSRDVVIKLFNIEWFLFNSIWD